MKAMVLSILFFSQLAFAQNKLGDDWHLQKVENGISVYEKDAENSKFKELKSVFQIKTSLSSVVALLSDFESYPGWVYRCGISNTIKKISESESLHYQTVVAPWPVDDRDIVVHVKISQDPLSKVITQKGICMPDAAARVDAHVRILLFKATWIITPLKNGLINIEYQLLVDPGGNVPAWLVNLAAVEGPYDTALAMKEWLLKEKYQKAVVTYIKEPE